MDQDFHFENGDINGAIAVTLANEQTLDDFCVQHVAEYNRNRFKAFAIRIYIGKENVVTIYAADKTKQGNADGGSEKVAVKKFKLSAISLSDILSFIAAFNCTLTTGEFSLEKMEIINK